MKNNDEHINEITQEQHERLCAYLFDELTGDERAAFEAELAQSAALRTERDRIEASMALVREFAPAPESLSAEGRAALTAAAAGGASAGKPAGSPGPRLAWYRHPGLQVAAAAVVAVVAFRSFDERLMEEGFGVRPEERVAHFDEELPKVDGSTRPEGTVEGWGHLGSLETPRRAPATVRSVPDGPVPVEGPRVAAESNQELELEALGYIGAPPAPSAPGVAAPSAPAPGKGTGGVIGSSDWFLGGNLGQPAPPASGSPSAKTKGQAGELSLLANVIYGIEGPLNGGSSGAQYYLGTTDEVLATSGDERSRAQRQVVSVEQEYERIIGGCAPRPSEKPSMMYFRYWGDNGYEFPVHDALSTFSIDVDTASYTLARRYLKDGYLPERAQIRTEEFVNYFTPDLPAPTDGSVFSIGMELAPSPFGPEVSSGGDHQLLRVGLRGMEVTKQERDPLALTFVIDVSGSMKQQNRLELVKHSLRLLVSELDARDQVAIVTFNNSANRVLDMTSATNAAAIETALYAMSANGGTNAEAGLRLGYEEAVLGHTPGSVNRVVFLSDGVGNIGETNENALLADVERAREKGIYLNTIGVGMGNHNDRFLEQLADGGDGLCNYVDGPEEAQRALVENFTGAFQPIARDVKIQVEFDPAQVASYRLLGYENRAIADKDFRNDKVDAGEVGAGHQVVALYEVVLLGAAGAAGEKPMATARVRYKQPYGHGGGDLEPGAVDEATEIEQAFWLNQRQGTFEGSSVGFQKSALAAQFAEFLRRSSHARGDSVSLLRFKLEELAKTTVDPELVELAALVQLAQPKLEPALLAAKEQRTPLQEAADDLHAFEYSNLRSVYLGGDVDEVLAAQLEAERQRLRDELKVELYAANGLELTVPEGEAR